MNTRNDQQLGAVEAEGGVHFRLWTDKGTRAAVVLFEPDGGPSWEEPMALDPNAPLEFHVFLDRAEVGSLYKFKLDGELLGDPYARCLPFGPLGPAQVVAAPRKLAHPKREIDFERGEVFYELHVGTFTPQGTFAAVHEKLAQLKELGVTVIELMPVVSFPGEHGWGYDGVGLFAPFAQYGTPAQLADLVDAVHGAGMSIVLDVVYNHLGPEGNSLPILSDNYFHHHRKNAWGAAPELEDGPFRSLILHSARYWLEDVGFDGLRLDAAHELEPGGEPHILSELAALAHACTPPAVIIAEDDRNDPEATLAHGLDAVWSDDFHHSLHVMLTGEREGYYEGYEGTPEELSRIIRRGQLYEGQPFPGTGEPRGKPALNVPRQRLVYSLQNHDQVGNRAQGERLAALVEPAQLRSALLLLAFLPATPLLFMGEEWGATEPFLYFTDHSEPLGSKVTAGRRKEFEHFAAFKDGGADSVPDPQARDTFERSKLPAERADPAASTELMAFYRQALEMRRELLELELGELDSGVEGGVLWVRRRGGDQARLLLFNVAEAVELEAVAGHAAHGLQPLLASSGALQPSGSLTLPKGGACIFAIAEKQATEEEVSRFRDERAESPAVHDQQ